MIDTDNAARLVEALAGKPRVVALVGPSGSGRTTLARRILARSDVTDGYHRVDWITLGVPMATPDDLPWLDSPAAVELSRRMVDVRRDRTDGWREELDPQRAANQLAESCQGDLLVVDEVRVAEQVALLRGFHSRGGHLLLITADASLLPSHAVVVRMEPLPRAGSVKLVGHAIGLDDPTGDQLAARAGDRPLAALLAGRTFARAYLRCIDRPKALSMVPSGGPHPMADAVAALSRLLSPVDRERVADLGVFPADQDIPLGAARRLWAISRGEAHLTCVQLVGAHLIEYRPDDAVFRLHEAVRRHLDAPHEAFLRAVDPGDGAWWDLPDDPPYLAESIVSHLAAAGRIAEMNRLVTDVRWASRRIADGGASALAADLAVAWAAGGTAGGAAPAVVALARLLRAEHHLFDGVRVPHVLAATLASRYDGIEQLRASLDGYVPQPPYLANRWPPAGRFGAAVMRRITVLYGANDVADVAVTPVGLWAATVDGFNGGGNALLCDPLIGRRRRTLHLERFDETILAPDGSWIAVSQHRYVQLLDGATGDVRVEVPGEPMATDRDGTRLAIGDIGGEVRLHDTATGKQIWVADAHRAPVTAVLLAPDGTWLASSGEDDTVQTLHGSSGRRRRAYDIAEVDKLAVAPGGEWLAAAGPRGVHLIDPPGGDHRLIHDGDGEEVLTLASAVDGSWLAAAYVTRGVRVWDTATGELRFTLPASVTWYSPIVCAPDGSWIATGSPLRFYDALTGEPRGGYPAKLHGSRPVAPDGSWLVASTDTDLVILDLTVPPAPDAPPRLADQRGIRSGAIGREALDDLNPRAREVVGADHHDRTVHRYTLSPDGRWLAVLSGVDSNPAGLTGVLSTLRVYDADAGCLAALAGVPAGVSGCRWSPDGSTLSVWGEPGRQEFTWVTDPDAAEHPVPPFSRG